MMTSAQVVETSVTVTDNSPFQDYPHPDDHTTRSTVAPGFKPFTVYEYIGKYFFILFSHLVYAIINAFSGYWPRLRLDVYLLVITSNFTD